MNPKLFFALAFMLNACSALAQTKKIAYKSHSGSEANYRVAMEEHLFDMDHSDFGAAPTREVKNAQLDSVIFLTDSTAVMVTSEYCVRTDWNSNKPLGDPRLWKAGRDTVYHHPLFSRQHALDSIRQALQTGYNFQNPVNKVVFIGYDNKKVKKRNKRSSQELPLPTGPGNDDHPAGPFDKSFYAILAGIFLLSLATAALIHFGFRRKQSRLPAAS